jgi:mannose-6-phosphate isomerase-like protein (cupin superfamily)
MILMLALFLLGPMDAARGSQHHVQVPFESLNWRRNGNFETALVEGDPARRGRFTMMLKLQDGAWIEPHWHNVEKRLVVIKGELLMGMGERLDTAAAKPLTPGGVAVVPANSRHFEGGRGETVVVLIADGPFQTTYVK